MRKLECDVLIIGSGAAGGTLAGTLAEHTSLSIVVLEKGGYFERSAFNQREWDMQVLYAERGARTTEDGAIPVRGGECVGGGTTVNVALCFDPIARVWQGWRQSHGVEGFSFDASASDHGVPGLSLARANQDVRARINVHTPEDREVNRNNAAFARGCAAHGIAAKKFELNMQGCIGCGFCGQGCAYDAKRGTLVTYLADAARRGVQILHRANVQRVRFEPRAGGLRAVGADVEIDAGPSERPSPMSAGPLRVDAKLVIVSAGAIETPLLLQRSEHPDPHGQIGRGLVLHPSLPVIGVMPQEIAGHRGIEGSMYSDQFAASHGFYLECLFGHPLYGSALLPGFGPEHFELMLAFRKLAGFGVMLVDTPHPENRVVWDARRRSYAIRYRLRPADAARLRIAAKTAVEVMFAAGAREVLLPSEEPLGPLASPRFSHPAQAAHLSGLRFLPHQTVITSAHCQATTRMGDKTQALLDSRCESHFVERLMVVDSSSFPGSCGANPMVSIMSLARYQGLRIAGELGRYGL
ncbi:MAG TPA: GMC family oxidoreductase [Polyangiaceae bacterium]|nr:GMC family oxidoreductase [Polyangiaceae bacterium]